MHAVRGQGGGCEQRAGPVRPDGRASSPSAVSWGLLPSLLCLSSLHHSTGRGAQPWAAAEN
eukprot:1562832-Alexandrium_andersonii.AAC.1